MVNALLGPTKEWTSYTSLLSRPALIVSSFRDYWL